MLTTNARMIRGYAIIAKGDEPILVSSDEFKIHSQSGNGYYLVRKGVHVWTCNCPDCFYRGVECKQLGRRYIGFENNEEYFEKAKIRLSQDVLI